MTKDELADIYRSYIASLNQPDFPGLEQFVGQTVRHNGRSLGLSGYRKLLQDSLDAIPDLYYEIELLLADPPYVACRLRFDCTPKGILFGLPVNGRRVVFTENVFYEFTDGRIVAVWSVIDKAAIETQIRS